MAADQLRPAQHALAHHPQHRDIAIQAAGNLTLKGIGFALKAPALIHQNQPLGVRLRRPQKRRAQRVKARCQRGGTAAAEHGHRILLPRRALRRGRQHIQRFLGAFPIRKEGAKAINGPAKLGNRTADSGALADLHIAGQKYMHVRNLLCRSSIQAIFTSPAAAFSGCIIA